MRERETERGEGEGEGEGASKRGKWISGRDECEGRKGRTCKRGRT